MKTSGPRLPRTRRWDDREGMAMTVSPLHILNLSSLGLISFVLEVGDGQAIPSNTQSSHDGFDDGDGPGFDDGDDGRGIGSVFPGTEGDEPDLWPSSREAREGSDRSM